MSRPVVIRAPFDPRPASRTYELGDVAYPTNKKRRDRLRKLRICLNNERHGAATHGVRCERCWLVYEYGAKRAQEVMP